MTTKESVVNEHSVSYMGGISNKPFLKRYYYLRIFRIFLFVGVSVCPYLRRRVF
jgi:hypothetical protein